MSRLRVGDIVQVTQRTQQRHHVGMTTDRAKLTLKQAGGQVENVSAHPASQDLIGAVDLPLFERRSHWTMAPWRTRR